MNRVYDGTTAASVTLSDNHLGSDVVTDSYAAASFADPNVANGKAVGVSGISIGGADAANYTLQSTTAATTANITPALLTVVAEDTAAVYGQANPAFTDTITGFVNGDTASVVSGSASLSTAATAGSGVGAYAIAAAQGSLAAANYTFAFQSGTLTVTTAIADRHGEQRQQGVRPGQPAFIDLLQRLRQRRHRRRRQRRGQPEHRRDGGQRRRQLHDHRRPSSLAAANYTFASRTAC